MRNTDIPYTMPEQRMLHNYEDRPFCRRLATGLLQKFDINHIWYQCNHNVIIRHMTRIFFLISPCHSKSTCVMWSNDLFSVKEQMSIHMRPQGWEVIHGATKSRLNILVNSAPVQGWGRNETCQLNKEKVRIHEFLCNFPEIEKKEKRKI